eukprot:NODE_113_length_19319_cov_0.247815.p5 type:complete len:409 gc:universal NODE_113_length_19319_cov_0.247815:15563-16789(+)
MNLEHRRLINEAIQNSNFDDLYSLVETDSDAVNLILHLASIMPAQRFGLYQVLCRPILIEKISAQDRKKVSSFSYQEMQRKDVPSEYTRLMETLRYLYTPQHEYMAWLKDLDYPAFSIHKFSTNRAADAFTFCDYAIKRFTKTTFKQDEDSFLDVGTGKISGSRQFHDDDPRLKSPNTLRIYTTFWKLVNQINKMGAEINQGRRIYQNAADVFFKRAEYITLVIFRFNTTNSTYFAISSDSNDFFDLMRARPFRMLALLKILKIALFLQLTTPEAQKEIEDLIDSRNGKWVSSYPRYTLVLPYLDKLITNIQSLLKNYDDYHTFLDKWELWKSKQLFEIAPPLTNKEQPLVQENIPIDVVDIEDPESFPVSNSDFNEFQLKRLAALDPRLGNIDDIDVIKTNVSKLYN